MTDDQEQTPEPGRKVSPPRETGLPREAEPPRKAELSKEPDRELVFYYNRERRLERASADVRALNEGRLRMQGGVVRSLTSTKPHLLLFITIMIIFAGMMVLSRLSGPQGSGLTLGGNALRISAGGGPNPFILVTKTIPPGVEDPYIGPALVGVSPFMRSSEKTDPADIPVFTEQIFFTLEDEETYRFDLPFGAESYLLLFQAGDQRVSARVRADK